MIGDGEDGEKAGDANDGDNHEVQENSHPAIGHVKQEEGDVVLVQHLAEPGHVREGVKLGRELMASYKLFTPKVTHFHTLSIPFLFFFAPEFKDHI